VSIIVEDAEGNITMKNIASGDFCLECIQALLDGMPWLQTAEEAIISLKESELMRTKTKQACAVKHGREEPSWPPSEQVFRESLKQSTFDIVIRGVRKEAWEATHEGQDPTSSGVLPLEEACPIHGPSEVYYTVAFYERRLGSADLDRLREDAMPARLYAEQPHDTFAALSSNRLPSELAGVKDAPVVDRLCKDLAASHTSKTQADSSPPPPSTPPAPRIASPGSVGLASTPFNIMRSSVFGRKVSGGPEVPLFPIAAKGPQSAASVAPTLAAASGPATVTPRTQAASLRISSEPPTTPNAKAGRVRSMTGGSPTHFMSPSWTASSPQITSPLAKAPRLSTPAVGLPQVLSLSDLAGKGLPGLLAHRNPIRDDDTVSMASFQSKSKDAASLAQKYPQAHKFERPLLEYTVESGLVTSSNVSQAMTQLKRAHTISVSEGQDEWAGKLKVRFEHLQSTIFMHAANMALHELKLIHSHFKKLIEAKAKFTASNLANWVVRRWCELLPPRSKDTPVDEIPGLVVYCQAAKSPAITGDPMAASFWSESFSHEDLAESTVPTALVEGFLHSVFPTLVREGIRRKQHLVDSCKFLVKMFSGLPAAYSGYGRFLRDLRAMILLYGITPFELDSTYDDLEGFVDAGGALLQALQETNGFSQILDGRNFHIAQGEANAWPVVEECRQALTGFTPVSPEAWFETIDKCLQLMPKWKVQIRDTALKPSIQEDLKVVFTSWYDHLQGDDVPDADKAAVELLKRLKKASVAWKDGSFGVMIDNLSVNAERHQALQEVNELSTWCQGFITRNDSKPLASHLSEVELLLPVPNTRKLVRVTDVEHQKFCWQALDQMSKDVWTAEGLPSMLNFVEVIVRFKDVVEILPSSSDTGFRQHLAVTHKRIALAEMIGTLNNAVDAFNSSGTDLASRMRAASALDRVKQVQAAKDRFDSDEIFKTMDPISPTGTKTDIRTLLSSAHSIISDYGSAYIREAYDPVSREWNLLQPLAYGGAKPHERWDNEIGNDLAIDKFVPVASSSLGKVDIDSIVAKCRSTYLVLRPIS